MCALLEEPTLSIINPADVIYVRMKQAGAVVYSKSLNECIGSLQSGIVRVFDHDRSNFTVSTEFIMRQLCDAEFAACRASISIRRTSRPCMRKLLAACAQHH